MTKVMNKLKRSKNNSSESKNISSESRTSQEFKNQEEFKTQEESLQSRIKTQDLKNQDQDSRIKRRLNQDKYEKFFFQKLSSTWIFLKTCLPKSFYSLVIDYQIVVIDYQ